MRSPLFVSIAEMAFPLSIAEPPPILITKSQFLDLAKATGAISRLPTVELHAFDQNTQLRKCSRPDIEENIEDHPYTSVGDHLVG